MQCNILTLFPNMFTPFLKEGVIGRAVEKKVVAVDVRNIRDFASGIHKAVDDKCVGGGAGMVMKTDVLAASIDSIKSKGRMIYLSPRGRRFDNQLAQELAQEPVLTILCGRYEGVDQRVLDTYGFEEVSIGDYILSGGEVAAIALIDSTFRHISGVLGNKKSLEGESFSSNLLKCDVYAPPKSWRGMEIPEVLLSGNHSKIESFRLQNSLENTRKKRPDLYDKYTQET
jgi:tRNA (guanine37-N1)-methyltransferase